MEDENINILLVDDDEEIYLWIQDLLEDAEIYGWVKNILCDSETASFKIDYSPTFDKALRVIKKAKHHVYLIDYQLGDKNGIDLLQKAIASGCKAPIIMLTGRGDISTDHTAMMTGAADYLNKYQLNAEVLEHSIRYALERKQIYKEQEKLISELQEALVRVKKLSGLLPICSYCKKIRNDKGYWEQVEQYIEEHSDVDFSHGICPDCAKEHYPEIFKDHTY